MPERLISSLKAARQFAGCRLLDAANAIGISESHLSRIEIGDYPLAEKHVAQLARLYAVTTSQLLGRDPLSVRGRPPMLRG